MELGFRRLCCLFATHGVDAVAANDDALAFRLVQKHQEEEGWLQPHHSCHGLLLSIAWIHSLKLSFSFKKLGSHSTVVGERKTTLCLAKVVPYGYEWMSFAFFV
jgi:hypothetical protein